MTKYDRLKQVEDETWALALIAAVWRVLDEDGLDEDAVAAIVEHACQTWEPNEENA